ncbi:IscA/HesB family protein [Paucidesulfovibrio longus]|uniref:IscA/HesB family protein n=1 Tax=Paucidesulfovibrio longus TaxID=889 RepID=UPI0003B6330E|nr:IscA/HesB family protein [Paucidesulfovibrio longus]
MLNLTEAALSGLKKYFETNDVAPIRVFVAQSCSGASLALGLDEVRDGDKSFDFDGGIKVVMEEELLNDAQPVSIDMGPMGFSVDSSLEFPQGGGCGCSSCGTGSCGDGGCH